MKNILKILLLIFSVISFNSCTKAFIADELEVTNPIDRTITYTTDVKQIMTNNCITCHGGPSPSASLDLTTYLNVKNATLTRNLLERMNDATSPMPQSGLLILQTRQIMDKWKADGYLEN
jgi:mono/diheme cytochrome c family protein